MSIAIEPSTEVIPGYVLTERIGSGGYAEVWRARAPGGIDKAVKLVHGYYDDEFAAQELKALERIKGVRHPFLLSLERFEIVNGRLAILTELADMSLEQRLRQCRAEGLTGIPRDEILRYLADAAEAIDYLSQRHGLLHLDIKPENLLISGDHCKVADFGLVKELANRTQNSLVAGLTPTYASPEMFDDAPSQQSDQYSLAIVYQEMLVGALPFPGRTAAQLAKQHTQAEPQLLPLPAHDRPIIARALAKNPADRYLNCRSFVSALIHSASPGGHANAAETEAARPGAATAANTPTPDDTQRASLCTTQRRTPGRTDVTTTQPIDRVARVADTDVPKLPACEPLPALDTNVIDVAVPLATKCHAAAPPTLYVAVGGAGIHTVCHLRGLLARREMLSATPGSVETIAIDTDRGELREACSAMWESPLDPCDTLHLPLRLPKCYDDSREMFGWVSRRWMYNIPRSLETRGYRPLGRVALVDHAHRVLALLDEKLELLAAAAAARVEGSERPAAAKVVLLAGMGGGTGGGTVIDVANAARSLAAKRGLEVEVHGFLLCTFFGNTNSSVLSAANSYAFLTELRHAAEVGNQGTLHQQNHGHPFESSRSPFDVAYCIPVRAQSARTNSEDSLASVAAYLALEQISGSREAIDACRRSLTPRELEHSEPLSLRTFGIAPLDDQERRLLWNLARGFAAAVKRHWLHLPADGDRFEHAPQVARAAGKTMTGKVGQKRPSGTHDEAARPEAAPADYASLFGEYAGTPFARGILTQLQRRLGAREDSGRASFTSREVETLVASAAQVAQQIADELSEQPADAAAEHPPSAFEELVIPASDRLLATVFDALDPTQPHGSRPTRAVNDLITAECIALIKEHLGSGDSSEILTALSQLDGAIDEALRRASADVLQCGHDRRTMMLYPANRPAEGATKRLSANRPSAAAIAADVENLILVCEGAGLSPRGLAIGLARVFPGISDAARRLFTRTDIEWISLI